MDSSVMMSVPHTNLDGHCALGSWYGSSPYVPHSVSNSPGASYSYKIGGSSVALMGTPSLSSLIRPDMNWWICKTTTTSATAEEGCEERNAPFLRDNSSIDGLTWQK
jgi:hypothetical protein